ncbi:hypothetical protein M9458_053789, partial [Cirrhinus mrigala]
NFTISIMVYALKLQTLAAASGWNERALLTTCRQGLNPSLHLQLAIYDDSIGLEEFIQNSICVARRMQNCFEENLTLL